MSVARFGGADFLALAGRHACIGLLLARVLMRRMAHLTGIVHGQVSLSAPGRVHAELLRLARLGDGRAITPPPVLSELADRLLTTRETVSRAVSALERRGLIRRTPETLVIVAPERLEELVI